MTRHFHRWVVVAFVLLPPSTQAQSTPDDSISLSRLQEQAIKRDARIRQLDILTAQSSLRMRNIAAENLPALAVNGQTQYQSTVATLPVMLPGMTIPKPPRDTYDASVSLRQRIFDPSLKERRRIELAQLEEGRSRIWSTLFALRQNVADAYFRVLEIQAQQREVETVITDLEAQHRIASQRAREGAALPSEGRILDAELIRRRQMIRHLEASSAAARAILKDLTGFDIPANAVMPLPDTRLRVTRARSQLGDIRSRPEFMLFAAQKEVIGRQRSAISARELPRLSAFARGGYGRPGLNPLASEFDRYWLGGLQLEWSPWTWGSAGRERQVLTLQQEAVDTEIAAFKSVLERAVIGDLADIDRLEASLEDDARIVDLRDAVLREARARYREGVITSAEYIDRQTDVLSARLALSLHRIELAEARARFLTTLGIEAP